MAIPGLTSTSQLSNDIALNSLQQNVTNLGLNICLANINLLATLLKADSNEKYSIGSPIFDMSCIFVDSDMKLTVQNKPILYIYNPLTDSTFSRHKFPCLINKDLSVANENIRCVFSDYKSLDETDVKKGITEDDCSGEYATGVGPTSGFSLSAPSGYGTGLFKSIDLSLIDLNNLFTSGNIRLPYNGKVLLPDADALGEANFGYIDSDILNFTDSDSLYFIDYNTSKQYKLNTVTGTLTNTDLNVDYFAYIRSGDVVLNNVRYWISSDADGLHLCRLDLISMELTKSSTVLDSDSTHNYSLIIVDNEVYVKMHGDDKRLRRLNKATAELQPFYYNIDGLIDNFYQNFLLYNYGDKFILCNTLTGISFIVTDLKNMSGTIEDVCLSGVGAPVVLNSTLNFISYKDYNFYNFKGMKNNLVLVSDTSSIMLCYGDMSSQYTKTSEDSLVMHQLFSILDTLNT